MKDVRFYKFVIFINAALPAGLLAFDLLASKLGANPIENVLRTTGVMTLVLILITLLITPLRKIIGVNELIKYRRMLGLFAFFYGCIHLLTYSIFDRGFSLLSIIGDVYQRPFVAIGMSAFALLIPLAITSTNAWIKRLGGKKWARLHMLVYPIACLGVIHFWMIVKSDLFYPIVFGTVVFVLLAYRAIKSKRFQKVFQASGAN